MRGLSYIDPSLIVPERIHDPLSVWTFAPIFQSLHDVLCMEAPQVCCISVFWFQVVHMIISAISYRTKFVHSRSNLLKFGITAELEIIRELIVIEAFPFRVHPSQDFEAHVKCCIVGPADRRPNFCRRTAVRKLFCKFVEFARVHRPFLISNECVRFHRHI